MEEALQALADLIESRDKSLSELGAAVEKDYTDNVNECIMVRFLYEWYLIMAFLTQTWSVETTGCGATAI